MSATARTAGVPPEDRPGRRTPAPPPPPPSAVRAAARTIGERTLSAARTAHATGGTPVRPARTHTAPVRTGSLRARSAARPAQPAEPAPRAQAGSTAVRGRGAAAAHRAPFVLLVVTLLVATALGLLFLNTAIAVNSLKATQLAAANEDRAQEVQRLEQQVISGGTPGELAEDAREAGMVPAGPAAHLVVGDDGSVTLRGEPVPAEDPGSAGAAGSTEASGAGGD